MSKGVSASIHDEPWHPLGAMPVPEMATFLFLLIVLSDGDNDPTELARHSLRTV
jgi:hypothetical protein